MLNRTLDQKSGLFWFVAGLVIIYFSVGYDIGSLGTPGPGYVSFLMGIIMSLLSAIMVLGDIHKNRQPLSSLFKGNWRRVLFTLIGLLLFAILLPYIGFMADAMILIYALILLAGKRKQWVAIVTAVIVSLASWYVFSVLLKQNLPAGVLGEWLKGRVL